MQPFYEIPRRVFASLALGVIPCALSAAHAHPAAPSIAWTACTADLVDERWSDALGERLECGSMPAPVEEGQPAKGSFNVGVVRFKAGIPAQREGSIFFNFGGPGANPLDMLPQTAYLWATRAADHPLEGDRKRLSDRFDLVAVVPRGLRGGTRFPCRPGPASNPGPDPTVYLADWNWAGFVREARAYAVACSENPLQRFGGTLQHARDMELARLALGEPVMNFVGVSYGSWVGAYYASMYATHVGRMVMDSVMNYAGSFEDQARAFPPERQALFTRNAVLASVVDPLAYRLGTDPAAVMARFRNMPHQARESWAASIGTPSHLAAALTLADWIRQAGEPDKDRLRSRAASFAFSPDPATDRNIRAAATKLVQRLGEPEDPTLSGRVDPAVYFTVVCGDTAWNKNTRAWRVLANDIARDYPAANGYTVTMGLVCANWTSAPRWRPSLAALAEAPPILMIQAEFDPATPYSGAMQAFRATPGAYMVLARGSTAHGLFGHSATPCVEHAVSRFLLSGELPPRHTTACDFVPSPDAPRSPRAPSV